MPWTNRCTTATFSSKSGIWTSKIAPSNNALKLAKVLGSNPVAVTSSSDFAPASSKEFLDIQATIECGFTLKCVRDMTQKTRGIITLFNTLGVYLTKDGHTPATSGCWVKIKNHNF